MAQMRKHHSGHDVDLSRMSIEIRKNTFITVGSLVPVAPSSPYPLSQPKPVGRPRKRNQSRQASKADPAPSAIGTRWA
jgi:hypothetical protein